VCEEPTAGGGADDTGLGAETTNKIDWITILSVKSTRSSLVPSGLFQWH